MIDRVNIEKERLRLEEMEREVAYARQNLSRREVIAKMQEGRERIRQIDKRDLIPADVDERYQEHWKEEQEALEAYEAQRLAYEQWVDLPWWKRWVTPAPPAPHQRLRRRSRDDH